MIYYDLGTGQARAGQAGDTQQMYNTPTAPVTVLRAQLIGLIEKCDGGLPMSFGERQQINEYSEQQLREEIESFCCLMGMPCCPAPVGGQ